MTHTPGPWRRQALGGCSTVLASERPARNDTGIPGYGYQDDRGHCIAYPFRDQPGEVRLDFVCFSHEDARLIADAPELLSLARQWAALDGGGWAVERHARERAELLARTKAIITRIDQG